MRMKKIAIGVFTLAIMGVYAGPTWAWLCHRCCGCTYSTRICCTPYNAFTPVCFGNITGLGCCPIAMSCCGGGQSCGGPSLFSQPMMCDTCDGACPSSTAPAPRNFTPPPPTAVSGPISYNWNQAPAYGMPYPMPYGMAQPNVLQTSYYPPYNPGYYPPYNGYWPAPTPPMPNYWYGR